MRIAPSTTTALARRTIARVLPWQTKGQGEGGGGAEEPPEDSKEKLAARTPMRRAMWTIFMSSAVALFWSVHVIQFTSRIDDDRDPRAALPLWKTFEALELRLYDGRFAARGLREPKSQTRIAIVAVDDSSLSTIGQWPWPRKLHARMVNKLKASGARVIALDFDFSDRQNPVTKNGFPQLSADDQALVAAAEGGNVIAPSFLGTDARIMSGEDANGGRGRSRATQLISPFDELDSAMPDISLATVVRDSDGGVRRWPFRAVFNADSKESRAVVGSFANLAVGLAQQRIHGEESKTYETDLLMGRAPTSGADWKPRKEVAFALEQGQSTSEDMILDRTLLNFWGPAGSFPTFSYTRVLNDMTPGQLRTAFKDRIVFVGATAAILKDNFPMPPIALPEGGYSDEISGVEMHASAAAMLLDGVTLREAPLGDTLAVLWAMTLSCAFLNLALRERAAIWGRVAQGNWREWGFRLARAGQVHDLVWLGTTLTAALLPIAIFWKVGQYMFNAGFWMPCGYVVWSTGVATLLTLARNFAEESAERRKTEAQFARRVSREVMDELLSHPEEEYPKPRRVEASVLFADLEGFTTFSENHQPEDVVAALNELFGRLEPLMYEYGATVDKYIGDAIMAFFGIPIRRHDHAARALACAVAMQDATLEFRADTGIEFYLRVGVHTGDVIVGCIGSVDRADYTVIGDTVNLASRLEGKNKDFGSWILCSRQTVEAAPDVVWAEPARAQIKGKAEAVDVFIVRGMKGAPPCDTRWGHEISDNEGTRTAELGDGLPQLSAPSGKIEVAVSEAP